MNRHSTTSGNLNTVFGYVDEETVSQGISASYVGSGKLVGNRLVRHTQTSLFSSANTW
uniref:MGC13008 protein n=1 Tax=Homo sapiens TaxID=9606 RepID=Q9BSF7_HUMAN